MKMKNCLECVHLKSYWKTVQNVPEFFKKYLCFECTKRGVEVDVKSKGSCSEFEKRLSCPGCGYVFTKENALNYCPCCFQKLHTREEATRP